MLFQLGNFTLNSGAKSRWKIECDGIADEDWPALAEMVRQMVGPFSSVEGVPRGGLKLAEALQPFVGLEGGLLITDDVLTTGNSMEKAKESEWKRRGSPQLVRPWWCIGAVVFARGPCPPWIKAVFQMPECFWIK